MKKLSVIVLATVALSLATHQANAQLKFGYISSQELISAMPEYKKADTAMAQFQAALNERYNEMVRDFNHKDSLLGSKDTAKYTKAQLELQRRDLGQLYLKIQGWQQEAQRLSQNKEQELLTPIYDKAKKAITDVAKENGYTFVFNKEQLLVSPPGDDLLPLVKKKLGLK